MKKMKKPAAVEVPAALEPVREAVPRWSVFFSCQRYPVYRSQLLTALLAGQKLDVERLPTPVLLDVLLLATASRYQHNAEIVTDYDTLIERVREEWARPDWTCKVFSSLHARWANVILDGRGKDFDNTEERYIPEFVGWYLNHDAPNYFSQEFESDKDVQKYRRAA